MHIVAVLVSSLYVPAGQLTHVSPERIRPASHCLVQPALKEPDHPSSHTHAEDWLLPVALPVFIWFGHAVQLAMLPVKVLYIPAGQDVQTEPLPKKPGSQAQLCFPGPVCEQME